MTRSRQNGLGGQLFSADWWLRFLAAVLFAFSANYERAHLSLESHVEFQFLAKRAKPASSVLEAAGGQDSGGHEPHPAFEHSMRMAPPAQATPLVFEGEPAVAYTEPEPPTPHLLLFLTERQNPPGIPPPDPFQPRAPPIA
jgi:hypothetical protein